MSDGEIKRIAIVTGASRGIGAATARLLAEQGKHVVCVARSAEKLEAVAQEIRAAGGQASVATCDIADGAQVKAMVEAVVKEHGRLDVLVNNAGMNRDNLMMRMSDEEFDEVITTNLRSTFVACRAAIRPMMKGKWGRIINLGSVAGLVGNVGQANYAAAKAGIVGLTRTLAKEVASKGVTANVVAPGFIETEMTASLPEQVKQSVLTVTPAGRYGQVREIAATVGFLSSEDAGYVTGQVLTVDGGMTMA